jgi:hypothetical protein
MVLIPEFRVQGSKLLVVEFQPSGFKFQVSALSPQVSGFKFQPSAWRHGIGEIGAVQFK